MTNDGEHGGEGLTIKITTLNILNTNGQVIYNEVTNQESITLNMDLPNGIYFVQLTNSNTNKTIKFSKQ